GQVAPGLICASVSNTEFLIDMVEIYKKLQFINDNGSLNLTTIVEYTSDYLRTKGLEDRNEKQIVSNVTIYPTDYFCPINMTTNELIITNNTYLIHHFAASWLCPWKKFKKAIRRLIGAK